VGVAVGVLADCVVVLGLDHVVELLFAPAESCELVVEVPQVLLLLLERIPRGLYSLL